MIDQDRWIVSASRRTDIPAFYGDWLRARVAAGWAASVNPFNQRATRVSLQRRDVRALVLWSKDLSRFVPGALDLRDRGYPLYFQYTVTGLPPELEPRVPPPEVTVPAAHALARELGPGPLQWRYDPILLGGSLDADWHRQRFRTLAARFVGATERCVISFATFYRKVCRNLAKAPAPGPAIAPPEPELLEELAGDLAETAAQHGMALHACCTPEALGGSIRQAACVDAAHLDDLYPGAGRDVPAAASRPGCSCAASRDIGLYDSCPHGCVYCYANAAPERARERFARAGGEGPVPFGVLHEDESGALRWRAG